MIPRPLTALRSFFWALLHPGRLTPEETAAFVAPERRIIVHPCHDPACSVCFDVKPDNVTLSRAELVTLLAQAMNAGALLTAVDQMEDERAIRLALSGDCLSWAHVTEKLLDASLARRAR